jgi:hypothetical protein
MTLKCDFNKLAYHVMRFGGQFARLGIFGKQELGPDDKVNDAGVDAIWPIISNDFEVGWVLEGAAAGGIVGPLEAFVQHEIEHRSVGFGFGPYEMAIPPQLQRGSAEASRLTRL